MIGKTTSHTGKYRYPEVWSNVVLREYFIAEGISPSGRRWAVIKQCFLQDWRSKNELYFIRIDMSEWTSTYIENHIEFYRVYDRIKNFKRCFIPNTLSFGTFSIMSPGLWDNGFSVQLCFEFMLAKYASQQERLVNAAKGDIDIDELDFNFVADEICSMLKPVFDFLASVGQPSTYSDDF